MVEEASGSDGGNKKVFAERKPIITTEPSVELGRVAQRIGDAAAVTFLPPALRDKLVPPMNNPEFDWSASIINKGITYGSFIATAGVALSERPVVAGVMFGITRLYRFLTEFIAREADAQATHNISK